VQLEADLQRGFEAFVAAARRLEQSHAALKARADEVERQLARTHGELARTLAEREAVLRALPAGVFALDADGRCRWTNCEGERLRAAAAAAGHELPVATAGETEIGPLIVRTERVALPDGGTLAVVEDRSRIVHLQREVSRLDRLAALSELALGIAHEIKNPLNGVLGFASLMQQTEDPARLRAHAQRVIGGVHQIDEIVRAMLGFARPREAGATAPLAQVVREAAVAAQVPPQRVALHGATDAPVDALALVRVLANLFRNSAEAAPEVRIEVTAGVAGNRLELLIADDGPGVPAALGQRVFEPFVTSKERGHGLGLALAARVVAFLDGTLELCNAGEPGARFRILLPARAEVPA
jgi:signal transduction histidine kinase